ncbi:TlyA family RNA methyltransferase [Brevundimonas aurifodinae]|uniref:TlyA family RNA methyltransferase n=2 Tax=Brevundimonas TaxID=41275 RepID=A0ABV1NL23_9CAUL|nr:MAG: TlyA family rRNA (cytidine-2'-O)-methyltransferase [Brevundimonas sp. 12-68-7]OYX31403.1 MAG: TlyA family rRNA (cytidine-2'-O)-methyltransferase [Brevundimonas subvibrioides]
MTTRLDVMLVSRGLVDSRARARAAIEAGGVTVNGRPARAASEKVTDDAVLTVEPPHPWVGRGAWKLVHALDLWPVVVEGRTVLDVGASTGGFTEVCLARGAARVFAVDVGSGQMHPRVAADARVTVLERTDARSLTPDLISTPPELIVCDASFISLIKVLPVALDLVPEEAELIALVKPQFEADGPGAVGKGGIVKDVEARRAAVERVSAWLESLGWTVRSTTESPIPGGDGNVEYLLWASRRPG